MKKILTNNIVLKLFSLAAAAIFWLVIVNVDDPTITRTYTGVTVDVENTEAITSENKTYEILDGSDTISVIVTAKRSVIEEMSRDYIKATANMKDITFMNTVPIEVRVTKYSDRIDSVNPITKNLKVNVEEMKKKQVEITVSTTGEPNEGYVTGGATSTVNVVYISGPTSVVNEIVSARANVDVTGTSRDISTNSTIFLLDSEGDVITDERVERSITSVHVDVVINGTKTVPISYSVSGVPREGYQPTGVVISEPDSVRIAGNSSKLENISSVVIPAEAVSLTGATGNVVKEINITKYLPEGITLADDEFDGIVKVVAHVAALETKTVSVPTANISVENVPEGMSAVLVDIGVSKQITVTGLPENLLSFDGSNVTGVIDASSMSQRMIEGTDTAIQGDYDGTVSFNLPDGISIVEPVYMEVILNTVAIVEPSTQDVLIEAPDAQESVPAVQ